MTILLIILYTAENVYVKNRGLKKGVIEVKNIYPNIPDINPLRIVIAGDWHRHTGANHARKIIDYAVNRGADGIVHVGDLGYNYAWGPNGSGYSFEKPLRNLLEKNNLFLLWIDGNHDNHAWLRSLPVREDGFVQTGSSGRMFWVPRGHRWTWYDSVFAGLGGAYSINKKYLVEDVSQFSEFEEVSKDDVATLGEDKVNVLFTHDVPLSAPVKSSLRLRPETERAADRSRILLQKAVENVKPDFLFSGHWHQFLNYELKYADEHVTDATVLNMEYRRGNAVLFDVVLQEVIDVL